MSARIRAITLVLLGSLLVTGCRASEPPATPVPPTESPLPPTAMPASDPTPTPPAATATPYPTSTPPAEASPPPTAASDALDSLLALISQERLFDTLKELTAIQPYSGWRNSATEGEAEALTFVANALDDLVYLQTLGLALERQSSTVSWLPRYGKPGCSSLHRGRRARYKPMRREAIDMTSPRPYVSTRMVCSTIRSETRSRSKGTWC